MTKRKRRLDPIMEAKGFVSVPLAAELLKMDPSHVHLLCKENKLEHVRVGGRPDDTYARTYIKRESLREFLGPEAAKLLKV